MQPDAVIAFSPLNQVLFGKSRTQSNLGCLRLSKLVGILSSLGINHFGEGIDVENLVNCIFC